MPENAVLYIRMSTDKQENSIDSQNNVLEAYAKTHKMKITGKYIDEGISGRLANKRPAFMRMIEDSSKKIFDIVLVYDSSRFARNLEESIIYKSILKKNGVQLISITEPSLDEDAALITDAMLGALNEMYSRKLSKAVKRGMAYNAQRGEYQTAPPYGYSKHNRIMEIVGDEAKVVRKVFELFAEYKSWHSVAVRLNHMGVPKRSLSKWSSADIKRMLHNPAYIGRLYYDGQIYQGNHQPIIETEIWKNVHAIIGEKPRIRHRPPSSYKHWLSGILKCAYCGGAMNYMKDRKGHTSYRCSAHANGRCQYSNFMSVSKLELLAKKALIGAIPIENSTEYEHFIPIKRGDGEMELLQSALKKVRAKLERHKSAYSAGVDILEEYKENKERCAKEEQEILRKIEVFYDHASNDEKIANLKVSISELIDFLSSENNSIEEKSIALKSIVHKIVLNKYTGEFTIFYFL